MTSWTENSRWWVVVGYALALASDVVALANQFPVIVHDHPSASIVIDFFLNPLVALSSLWAWWWLTQVVVTTDQQRRVVRQGLVGLVFALVGQAALYVTSFTELADYNAVSHWVLVAWTLSGLGALAAAVGFVGAFARLRSSADASPSEETRVTSDAP